VITPIIIDNEPTLWNCKNGHANSALVDLESGYCGKCPEILTTPVLTNRQKILQKWREYTRNSNIEINFNID
jgi:hypothetical protein